MMRRPCVRAALLGILMTVATASPAESLYREGEYRPLTSDNRAFRVGDSLTVQVIENSSATSSADTSTNRNNSLATSYKRANGRAVGAEITVGGQFEGGGQTQRSNRLLATLTVTVVEVLPNRDLRVAGEQLLTVNEEPQKVTLTGRVRPYDVSDGNVVLSTRLADGQISYVGEGELAERNRRPWWRKLLDWIGT